MNADTAGVLARLNDVCDQVLAPRAAATDREGVTAEQLQAVAATGALSLPFPTELGGLAADADAIRQSTELLAGACANTWFAVAQHRTPTTWVIQSSNTALTDKWSEPLVRATSLSSISFSHLRRPQQKLTIRRVTDGYVLDGSVDWVTNWPLSAVCLVQALLVNDAHSGPDEELVASVLIEPQQAAGITAGPPRPLAAMNGTHSWPVTFDRVLVSPDALVAITPKPVWLTRANQAADDAHPAVFGIAQAAINDLSELGEVTGQRPIQRAADQFATELEDLRGQSYALADQAAGDPQEGERTRGQRLRLRAAAFGFGMRVASAQVAATGGAAISADSAAMRRLGQLGFLMVQGQTRDSRAATLADLTQSAATL